MKSFLLLILSLMTGCEVSSGETEIKGCHEGWVEFTCKYPKTKKIYQRIDVETPRKGTIRSTQKDVWENRGDVSLFHDTKDKNLRVAIKQLKPEDFGEYECEFCTDKSSDESDEVKLNVVAETTGCQTALNQTANRTAPTTISCDYSGRKSNVRFICKDNGSICEDILSTTSSPKSSGTFTLTETTSGFNMSISDVSPHDAGVYWCGEETEGRYRAALRKIQLEVEEITTTTVSLTIGQNLTYWCQYPNGAPIKKFICKGEDPSTCQHLVSTTQLNKTSGRFSIREDNKRTNISITVREVTADDTGTYWCGAESSDQRHSNTFVHRLVMTVVSPTTSIPSIMSSTSHHSVATSSAASMQSTTGGGGGDGGEGAGGTGGGGAGEGGRGDVSVTVATAAAVCAAVLVLVLVLVYKRFKRSENTRNGREQENKEERAYEEIQERPQEPNPGTALEITYATVNFPTNPSASHHNSNINVQNSSGEVGGDTYFTVRGKDPRHLYSTVNHPSRLSQDPFYSTVTMPL